MPAAALDVRFRVLVETKERSAYIKSCVPLENDFCRDLGLKPGEDR